MKTCHAYVILAHNEPEILKALVEMVDDERNDIFIHIDAKSDISQFKGVKALKSKIIWTPRVKTYWGGPSLMRAEMIALRCARENGPYERYHLISGVDLPIHTQDYIHKVCDEIYPDKEFIGFDSAGDSAIEFQEQWKYYFVLLDFMRIRNPVIRKTCSLIRHIVVGVQRMTGCRRKPMFEVKKGTNWVSITDKMLLWMLTEAHSIYKFLVHSHCSDEKIFQTGIWNSPYRNRIFDKENETHGCMREIDWIRGGPYVWTALDEQDLRRSECFFARKFSSKHPEIVRSLLLGC